MQSNPIFTLENSRFVTVETACIQPSPASGIRSAGRYKKDTKCDKYRAGKYHHDTDCQIVWCRKIGHHVITKGGKVSEYNANENLQKLYRFELFAQQQDLDHY